MSTPSLTSTHVLNNVCEHCAELEAQLERTQVAAEMDMASLGAQLASMKRENDLLRGRLADRVKDASKRDHEAYKVWLDAHKKDPELKANAFGPAAQSALTRARKAGLDQDDILKVIRSHARYPFLKYGAWDAKGGQRKDKLSDAFKNEDRWGSLLELADKPLPSPTFKTRQEDHYITQGQSRPIDNLFAALERNDHNPYLSSGQGSAHCPIHDDRERSFRFKEKSDGGVVMHCFACSPGFVSGKAFCEQVRQDLELPITDLYPNQRS